MPVSEENFNDPNLLTQTVTGSFGAPPTYNTSGDYMVLSVENNRIRTDINSLSSGGSYGSLFSSNNNGTIIYFPQESSTQVPRDISGPGSDFKIYRNLNTSDEFQPSGSIYIKANEILNSTANNSGNYTITYNFLNQFKPVLSTMESFDSGYYHNGSEDNTSEYLATLPFPRYFEEFDANNDGSITFEDYNSWIDVGRQDIADFIWDTETGSTLNDLQSFASFGFEKLIITQISPSRKEVRLELASQNKIVQDSPIIEQFKEQLGDPTSQREIEQSDGTFIENPDYNPFKFSHMLNSGYDLIPITNYLFDEQPKGVDDQSIILRFNDPLPSGFSLLYTVTIEKEILKTQLQNVEYLSDFPELPPLGSLEADVMENWITNPEEESSYQNLNELSSSLSQEVLDSFVTKSSHDYPNLNTDFNHFENHTFFGSAKIKLENFKNKVETIQGYYSEISSSLVAGTSGSVTIESSSNSVVQYRNNLFDKIDDEINSFTPYEKFLYFDGQSESTASAPGIGKNYASNYAMAENIFTSTSEFIGKNDGLPLVYRFSQSLDLNATRTELFRDKYRLEKKPFFNYSSSIYLSFLMKSDQAFGKMTASTAGSEPDGLKNRKIINPSAGDGDFTTPFDTIHKRDILAPSLTGSEYRRCVFEASASYWQPALTTLGVIPIANNDLNFNENSTDVIVLSGSIKTGSHSIEAEGDFQNLATFIPTSGSTSDVPFTGSINPSGDLFPVYAQQGYILGGTASFNIDNATSGSNISESMVVNSSKWAKIPSNNAPLGTIPSSNKPRVSDGLIAHGRQYGKSMFFVSGTSEPGVGGFNSDGGILTRYDGNTVNFSKSGSFSLSIWAKRFHPETGSADQADIDANASQRLIGRGNYDNAYGIEYRPHTDEINAKIRSGSASATERRASFVMSDNMTGSFHHIVMTFESGSETGLKLYVNGKMKDTATTLGMHGDGTGGSATGTGEISVINPEDLGEQLEIGGGNIVGGNNYGFNGYLQYPRVYGKTLTDTEVLKLYENPDGILEGEITDVKVTLNDPSDAQPFSQLYHTGSTTWKTWYDGMYDSASAFDDININSLENNLPSYIKESSEYDDLKKFLGLVGEQFDVVRDHIDDIGSLYNRKYKEKDSVPSNALPIILDNLGWDAINPYTGSLGQYFGNHESSVVNVKSITNSTWRKTLNNLLYLYKTKGTKNSVQSLFNIYGYPSDVIQVNEFGGANEPQNDSPFKTTASIGTKRNDTDLKRNVGNVQFTSKKGKLYHYRFNKDSNRTLQTDWWSKGANANTIQFVYKHRKSDNTQELLVSSGSGATPSTATIHILTGSTAPHDDTVINITSSDGTAKTYIFDQDNDGATGTLDGDGRVRIQINGLSTQDEIALEVSKSISSVNGHKNKISVSDSSLFLTSTGQTIVTSDGKIFTFDSSGSIFLTQVTASVDGNKTITTNNPSASVSGFDGGSEAQSLWDLTLVPSSSVASGITSSFGSFRFRLNNTKSGSSGNISSNGVSMSLDYNKMNDGQLWNVMLQRMSSSVSGSGTQEYRLYSSLQHARRPDVIETLSFTSMSVSGGLTEDSNNLANQNWPSSGSRPGLTGSNDGNLYIGRTLSGSIAELRTWTTALSASRFRMHTLNKFGTVGNSVDSHRKELIYRFKLNENYVSSSISSSAQQTINIVDSAPKETLTTDYTFTMTSSLALSSSLYGYDMIGAVVIGLQDVDQRIENDNKIIINPKRKLISNLNPFKPSVKSLYQKHSRPKRTNSMKLDLNVSPQNYVNNFILEKIQGFNLETLYGNPQNYFSSSYLELDNFRDTFFKNYPITVDTNKFIRKHESIFNNSIIDAIKKVVPGRTPLSDKNSAFGVTIKPHILEKSKTLHKRSTLEVNPNLFSASISITSGTTDYQSGFNLTSSYTPDKSASIGINDIINYSSSVELPRSSSISLKDIVNYSSSVQLPKSSSISIKDIINYSSSLEVAKSSSILIFDDIINYSSSLEVAKTASILLNEFPSLSGS
mgnify:CR=1 FL=1